MGRKIFTRTNLLLETNKITKLARPWDRPIIPQRCAWSSPATSWLSAIEERLAIESGLRALRDQRRQGRPDDAFGRSSSMTLTFLPAGALVLDTRIDIRHYRGEDYHWLGQDARALRALT